VDTGKAVIKFSPPRHLVQLPVTGTQIALAANFHVPKNRKYCESWLTQRS